MLKVDVCIVGAGPAGSTLSHFLHKLNIDHLLIDKSDFPRDKICGDGITVDVLNVLKRIDPELLEKFCAESEMLPSWGFCFNGPKGQEIRYDFRDAQIPVAPFYTARRLDLDDFLIRELPENGSGQFWPQTELVGLSRSEGGFIAELKKEGGKESIHCKTIIGAEGEKPVVTRYLGLEHFREKEHLLAAIRIYYKNVQGFNDGDHLEFFFDKDLLPGYFWAFPLTNNEANVGLGMLSTAISAKKINLKKMFDQVIEKNPYIQPMFEGAEALEKTKGWGLPIMTPKRRIAGDAYALIGDAGGMIEAFTGKGIGPGMMSARILSEHLERAFQSNNFDLSPYHDHMYRYYRSEISNTYRLQKSLKHTWILNPVMSLASWSAVTKYAEDKMIRNFLKWV
ncbi:MAG: NAD(P)/FAD-dependent oxidoreductase [Croceimicrobium sp.]|nr:NAD(P)/FAD-dependent oxidoreductase [Bacteroidota bacterium]